MPTEKKGTSPVTSTLSTGGLGAIFSGIVTIFWSVSHPDLSKALYLVIPIFSAGLTYIMNWVIARHGLESPEDAAKRAKCQRDIDVINKHLENDSYSSEFKAQLVREKEKTVLIMISIGKDASSNQRPLQTEQTPE